MENPMTAAPEAEEEPAYDPVDEQDEPDRWWDGRHYRYEDSAYDDRARYHYPDRRWGNE